MTPYIVSGHFLFWIVDCAMTNTHFFELLFLLGFVPNCKVYSAHIIIGCPTQTWNSAHLQIGNWFLQNLIRNLKSHPPTPTISTIAQNHIRASVWIRKIYIWPKDMSSHSPLSKKWSQ